MQKKGPRFVFIDALRGLAVFAMLETHVVHAIMANEFKTGGIYNFLNILNGFIAVGFLFFAGSGFWIAATRKWNDYKHFNKPLFGHLQRLGIILILAYFIHLPVRDLFKLPYISHDQLLAFSECDVLQTIVISSVMGIIILLLSPNEKYLKYAALILTLLFFGFAPLIWSSDPFTIFPTMLGTYFSKPPISKFPLFPWSGYFFAGVTFTAFFFSTENKKLFAKLSIVFSIVIGFILLETQYPSMQLFNWFTWWHAHPFHSVFRVCGIVLLFGISFLLEDKIKNSSLGKAFAVAGQESLLVYVGHLLIVYGSIINYGFNYMLGPRATPLSTAIVTIVMCVFFYYASYMWNTFKHEYPVYSRRMVAATFLLVLSAMTIF